MYFFLILLRVCFYYLKKILRELGWDIICCITTIYGKVFHSYHNILNISYSILSLFLKLLMELCTISETFCINFSLGYNLRWKFLIFFPIILPIVVSLIFLMFYIYFTIHILAYLSPYHIFITIICYND